MAVTLSEIIRDAMELADEHWETIQSLVEAAARVEKSDQGPGENQVGLGWSLGFGDHGAVTIVLAGIHFPIAFMPDGLRISAPDCDVLFDAWLSSGRKLLSASETLAALKAREAQQ